MSKMPNIKNLFIGVLLFLASFLYDSVENTHIESKAIRSRLFATPSRAPVFVPVVIPLVVGRTGYSYKRGLRCYNCEGWDNDICAMNPQSFARRVQCPRGQVCSVIRKEIIYKLPQELNMRHTNKTLLIIRGCNSPDLLPMKRLPIEEDNRVALLETYRQFCLRDFCNVGDGRLKCYDCRGEGIDHPCMTRPNEIAKVTTCKADQHCNVMRTIRSTVSKENSTAISVSIERKCENVTSTKEFIYINGSNASEKILSLSCSSDVCNSIDANFLYRIYTSDGSHDLSLTTIWAINLIILKVLS